jgi:hypothetical protein
VIISNVVVHNADSKYASIISGIPGSMIEDVRLSNIRIYAQGGGTKEQAAVDPPEREAVYPEPAMFGDLPAYGFLIRHVKGLQLRDVELSFLKPDVRPPFWLNDVSGISFINLKAQRDGDAPLFVFKDVSDFSILQSWPLPDQRLERVASGKL